MLFEIEVFTGFCRQAIISRFQSEVSAWNWADDEYPSDKFPQGYVISITPC